jgi:biopolymer transport protein ExbD
MGMKTKATLAKSLLMLLAIACAPMFAWSQGDEQAEFPQGGIVRIANFAVIDVGKDNEIAWNGSSVSSGAELRRRLSELARTPGARVQVRPSKLATYADVYHVISEVRRAKLELVPYLVGNMYEPPTQ